VADNAAPGATVLHHRSSLWYMVLVEERRQDLTLVDPFKTSWIRYNDIVWPEPLTRPQADARYDLDDTTGVAAAGSPAQARLRDEHGQRHYVMVEPANAGDRFPEGETVIIVRRDGATFYAVRNDEPALQNARV